MEEIIKDKKGIDFSKFVDKETGTPFVFTTTFLITYKNTDGKDCYIARSVKSANELEKKHIIEKYEVERRYFDSMNIDWGIITQNDIPVEKAKNIEWIYSSLDECEMNMDTKEELSRLLLQNLKSSQNNVRKITSYFDKQYNLDVGTGLFLFKYLIAKKTINVNMDKLIDINVTLDEIILQI